MISVVRRLGFGLAVAVIALLAIGGTMAAGVLVLNQPTDFVVHAAPAGIADVLAAPATPCLAPTPVLDSDGDGQPDGRYPMVFTPATPLPPFDNDRISTAEEHHNVTEPGDTSYTWHTRALGFVQAQAVVRNHGDCQLIDMLPQADHGTVAYGVIVPRGATLVGAVITGVSADTN